MIYVAQINDFDNTKSILPNLPGYSFWYYLSCRSSRLPRKKAAPTPAPARPNNIVLIMADDPVSDIEVAALEICDPNWTNWRRKV
jgi:hypothetical protein